MTLELFEKELRKECKRLYQSLRGGIRQEKLKSKKKINSLTDMMFIGRLNPQKLFRSCIITFGNVLEEATLGYAMVMKAKGYRNTRFLSSDIDIVFRIRTIVYNLESKANIELDAGKTKKALETLKRKHKIVFNALDCQNEGWRVISKFVVWTKKDARDAAITAKKPIKEEHLMGFKDFFEIFNVQVTKEEFFNMLQRVWIEEVEKYFENKIENNQQKLSDKNGIKD